GEVGGAEAISEADLEAAEAAQLEEELNSSTEGTDEETMEFAGEEENAEVSEEMADAIEAFDNDEDLEDASDDSNPLMAGEEETSEDDELPFYGEADEVDEEGETT